MTVEKIKDLDPYDLYGGPLKETKEWKAGTPPPGEAFFGCLSGLLSFIFRMALVIILGLFTFYILRNLLRALLF